MMFACREESRWGGDAARRRRRSSPPRRISPPRDHEPLALARVSTLGFYNKRTCYLLQFPTGNQLFVDDFVHNKEL